MTTVAILPIADATGGTSYRAISGGKSSTGATAGQALDALTVQLGEAGFSALLVIQSFRPDTLFGAEQQQRLAELMEQWRLARDRGQALPTEQQTELDTLVEAELHAATVRAEALTQPASA